MGNVRSFEALAWLERAKNDLRGAEVDLAASPPLIEDALFHCQQAVEKALKGFLTFHGAPFRRTHDLDELAMACERIDPSLRPSLEPALDLTVFAWHFRYPGFDPPPPESEAQNSLVLARSVVETVSQRLQRPQTPD